MSLPLVFLIVMLYFVSNSILMSGFYDVEEAETKQDVLRAVDTLNDSVAVLNRTTTDWSNWDDTYKFVEDGNPEFIDSNLAPDASWVNNKVNVMIILDKSGQVVFQNAFDLIDGEFVPVPESLAKQLVPGSPLLPPGEENAEVTGLLMLPEGPMIISAHPIFPTEIKAPAKGTFIWGRFLDEAEIEQLSKTTHSSLTVERLDEEGLPADFTEASSRITPEADVALSNLDDQTIAGYARLDDINGKPALMLRVDQSRDIQEQGIASMRYLIFAILGVGLVFGLITTMLIEKTVLSRVARIGRRVGEIEASGDHSERISLPGKDDLSLMAGKINNMLAALELSQVALQEARDELEVRILERTSELRQKVTLLKVIAELGNEVIASTDTEQIRQLVCKRAADLLQAPKSLIALKDFSPREQIAFSHGLDKFKPRNDLLQTLFTDEFTQRALTDRSAYIYSAQTADGFPVPSLVEEESIEAIALSPLNAGGQVFGVLMVFDTMDRTWSRDEMQALELVAEQAALALESARLFKEEETRRGELSSLYELSRTLSDCPPQIDAILDLVTHHAVETINVTFASAMLIEDGLLKVVSFHPHRILNQGLSDMRPVEMENLPHLKRILADNMPSFIVHDSPNLTKDERLLLYANNAQATCVVPLRAGEKIFGFICLGEARRDEREPFSREKQNLARGVGDQTSSALRRAELFNELENAYLQTVLALARAVDAKDSYTADHGDRLAELATRIGEKFGMGAGELDNLGYGALLHDVGKIGIPDAILNKPGKLNEEEWVMMRTHPSIGENILSPIPHFGDVAMIVRQHHEHFDGGGYPDGRAGDEISLAARILTVVDSYSAMTDRRTYKEAFTHEVAIAELKRCSGTQFDPVVVEIFLDIFEIKEAETID
ncbi:MAG: CHASE4 domain-containing protein [Thermoleophilia bacterium]